MPTPLTSSRTSTFSLSQRSNDVRIDSLLDGTKWGGALHTGVTLTYSFPGATSFWDTPYGSGEPTPGGFHILDAAEKVIVRKAMSVWSMYSNLKLVETSDTSSNVGDVRIAKTAYGHTGSDVAAHAYQPTAPTRNPESGDIWLNYNHPDMASLRVGSIGYGDLLHEIGHALGLKHPFEPAITLPTHLRTINNTIMTYGNHSDFGSPSPFDVSALQFIYGANMNFNKGNNTYSFSTLASMFGKTSASAHLQVTLWDAGGIDTFVSAGSKVDLRPWSFESTNLVSDGIWSSFGVGGDTIDVKIAKGAVIENVTMLETNVEVIGNGSANILRGYQSSTMRSSVGSIFVGEGGNDTIYADRAPAADGELSGSSMYGCSGHDTFVGAAYGDHFYGGAGNDRIKAGAGADRIAGGTGTDTIDYSASSSGIAISLIDFVSRFAGMSLASYDGDRADARIGHLIFDSETSRATGSGGNAEGDLIVGIENIIGTNSSDSLNGNASANAFYGLGSSDTFYGYGGNDVLNGGLGDDFMHGMSGYDTASYSGAFAVRVNLANTTVQNTLGAGFDTLIDIENLIGSSGGDQLYGDSSNNVLVGGGGYDRLDGREGNDRLVGGTSRDTLTGGSGPGRDVFEYNAFNETGKTASTRDYIVDFVHGVDKIDLLTIDANGTAAGSGTFKFLAAKGAAFTGVKGQLHWFQVNSANPAADRTYIEGDINGDKRADFQIELKGLKVLAAYDFVL